jgi:SPP1 family predicted phage head-tail adaptor
MRAGSLDTTIVIQRDIGTELNDYNERIEVWTTHLTARARLEYSEGDEAFAMSQRYEVQPVTLTMRWNPDVLTTDRVLMDGRLFDIKAVRPSGKRRREAIELKLELQTS